jgi:hypothetical protein
MQKSWHFVNRGYRSKEFELFAVERRLRSIGRVLNVSAVLHKRAPRKPKTCESRALLG